MIAECGGNERRILNNLPVIGWANESSVRDSVITGMKALGWMVFDSTLNHADKEL